MSVVRRLLSPSVAPFMCLVLVFVGLIVDLNTDPALVVAIVYNVPIAISAAVLSRTLTVWTIVMSLAANLAAGWVNAAATGEVDTFVVLNRSAAAVSFLIVGAMTLLFEARSDDVRELHDVEDESERERTLRTMLIQLSRPLDEPEMLTATADELRKAMRADAVVIAGLDGDRFAEPRWASPSYSRVAEVGKLASWAVDALPVTAAPVITVRSDEGTTTVGRLAGPAPDGTAPDDLVIVVRRSSRPDASRLLGEALELLVPLRERAHEIGRLRRAADGASGDVD